MSEQPARATVAKRSRFSGNGADPVRPLVPDFFGQKKRKVVENMEEHVEDEWNEVNDTEMALRMLKRDWKAQMGSTLALDFPTIIFKSQLYYLIGDKTKVDREVAELKRDGKQVELLVPGHNTSDVYICSVSELDESITSRINKVSTMKQEQLPFSKVDVKTTISILTFFKDVLIATHTEPFILREKLHDAFDDYLDQEDEQMRRNLAQQEVVDGEQIENEEKTKKLRKSPLAGPASLFAPSTKSKLITPVKKSPKIKYSDMERVLVNEGWLTRRDDFSYHLALPNFGRFLRSLSKGRRHIVSILKRAKFNEKMQADLLQIKKIQGCELSVAFVLKDLLGSSVVSKTVLGTGTLIRLSVKPL